MVAYIEMDSDGHITLYSGDAVEIFGYSLETAMGQKLSELIIHSDHRGKHDAGFTRFKETGEAHLIGKQRLHLPYQRADGSQFKAWTSLGIRHEDDQPRYTAQIEP